MEVLVVASLVVLPDGRIDEASDAALTLLGVTIEQLRELPPGSFSPESRDEEAEEAFRQEWEASGRHDIAGLGTLRLLDGQQIRVRFAITPISRGRFLVILEKIAGQVSAPPQLYTGDEVIARWRPEERRLETLDPDDAEAAARFIRQLRNLGGCFR